MKLVSSILNQKRTGGSPIEKSSVSDFPKHDISNHIIEHHFDETKELSVIKQINEKMAKIKRVLLFKKEGSDDYAGGKLEYYFYFECISPLEDIFLIQYSPDSSYVNYINMNLESGGNVGEIFSNMDNPKKIVIKRSFKNNGVNFVSYDEHSVVPVYIFETFVEMKNMEIFYEKLSKEIINEQMVNMENNNKLFGSVVDMIKIVNENSYNLYSLYINSKSKVKNEKILANDFLIQAWKSEKTFNKQQEDKFDILKKRKNAYDQIIGELISNMRIVSDELRPIIDQNYSIIFQNVNLWVQVIIFFNDKNFNSNHWTLPKEFTNLKNSIIFKMLSGDDELFDEVVTEFIEKNSVELMMINTQSQHSSESPMNINSFQDLDKLVKDRFTEDILIDGNSQNLFVWNWLISIVVLKNLIENYTKDLEANQGSNNPVNYNQLKVSVGKSLNIVS